MAIPNRRISITLRDSEGSESVMTFYSNADLDDGAGGGILNEIANVKGVIAGVSDATIAKVEVTEQDTAPATGVPAGNVDNEIQAKFAFYTEDATVSTVSVPAFKRSLLEPNTNRVDTDQAAVQAFIDMMTTGDVAPRDTRGADLVSLKSALEHYSRRRQ